ncbi:MAG: DUF6468 domain-containing protein [Alphaproteobacteria bacterium]|nr:DUF6468 domain-containing protein [Alphaproteobacteria bacterium]
MIDFSNLSLILDLVVAVLLVAVIIYAVRLNAALRTIKESKAELETLLAGFGASTAQAEDAIRRIKEASGSNSAALKGLLGDAETLRDDLSYLIERGERVAGALETGVTRRRETQSASGQAAPPAGAARNPQPVESDIAAAIGEARQLAAGGDGAAAKPAPGGAGLGAKTPDSEDRALLRRALSSADMEGDAAPRLAKPTASTAGEGAEGQGQGDGESGRKTKSALLRALQGMR